MAIVSKATLKSFITSNITTNGTRDITGAKMNTILTNIVDSLEGLISDYTTANRNAISSPDTGLMIYNTDNKRFEYYDGSSWKGVEDQRVEDYLYIKGNGNTDLTANEANDLRVYMDADNKFVAQIYSGASWSTYGHFMQLPLCDATQTGTTAVTTEETLYSGTLSGGTLSTDCDFIEIYACGTTGANANNKTIKLKFGATVFDSGANALNADNWEFRATVLRTGATTQKMSGHFIAGDATSHFGQFNYYDTPAETLANDITIAITGQNGTASANDIVLEMITVKLYQF